MTKDNLIFLGACSLLAPSTLTFPTTEEMRANSEGALSWSKNIYEKQHGGDNTAAPAVAAEPPTTLPYFIVEQRVRMTRSWSRSIVLRDEFTSEEAADIAIDQYTAGRIINLRFRVVRKERAVNPVYIVERKDSKGNGWSESCIINLRKEFCNEVLAEEAIRNYGARSFRYRVVKK